MNNPDSVTGFAGYYGLALISDSWTVFALALFSQGSNYLFVRYVERNHMKKLHGDNMRSKNGVQSAVEGILREAVESNPHLQKLTRSASELQLKLKEKAASVK